MKDADRGEAGQKTGAHPLAAGTVGNPYRRGMLLIARATSRAERSWLLEVLDGKVAG